MALRILVGASNRGRASVHRRLAALERIWRGRISGYDSQAPDGSHLEIVRAILLARGVQQSPTESLAEAFARALGLTCRELRVRLQQGSSQAAYSNVRA